MYYYYYYYVSVRHIKGVNNTLSDFGSRQPSEYYDESCCVCKFIQESEDSVVRSININDILSGKTRLPFTSRVAWFKAQLQCTDLRRVI